MLIGVLSDTHLQQGRTLPRVVWESLANVEMILHAGDIVSQSLLEDLAALAPVQAVKGNCDLLDLDYLPSHKIINCAGKKIGLVHGNHGVGKETAQRAFNVFANENVDAVVFGHSHIPMNEFRNGVLLFNPGSPVDKRREKNYSLGFIVIDEKGIQARHFFF